MPLLMGSFTKLDRITCCPLSVAQQEESDQ